MNAFEEAVTAKKGCAVVIAGSDSDETHIKKIAASLHTFGIPFEVRICSAHKSPQRTLEIARDYDLLGGPLTYVAVAGGTDALSGTLAWHTTNPVISCPPDAPNDSCLTNPPGSSNAYIAHPANVGRFIAQMYSGINPAYREAILKSNMGKVVKLNEKDLEFRARSTEDWAKLVEKK